MRRPRKPNTARHFIAEYTVTAVMLLFGATSVLQAFVAPTGTMESTVLMGDHLLVDKLAEASSIIRGS